MACPYTLSPGSEHVVDVCVTTDDTLKILFYSNGATPVAGDIKKQVPDWDGSTQTAEFTDTLNGGSDCTNPFEVEISVTGIPGTNSVSITVTYRMSDCNNQFSPDNFFYGCENPAVFTTTFVQPLSAGTDCHF